MLGFLRRNLKTGSRKIKERAYKAMIRPILEYASSVWDPPTPSKTSPRAACLTLDWHQNTSSVEDMLEILQ